MECPSYETLLSKEKLIKVVQTLCYKVDNGGGGGGGTSFSDLGFNSFNSATTYSKGDVVEKDGTLYEFTTSHTGDWDASDVQETSVEALIDNKELVANKVTSWQSTPDNEHYPSEKLVYDEIGNVEDVLDAILGGDTLSEEKKMTITSASGTALIASVDNYYLFSSEVGTLAITLITPTDTTHITKAVFMLTTGSTPAVTFAGASGVNVIAQDGFSIEASTTYEINAIFNGTAWVVAAMKLSSTPINS